MKNRLRTIGVAVALSFALSLIFAGPAAADKDNDINIYSIYGWGAYADSQYLQAFHGIMSAVLKELGMNGKFEHFENEKDFFNAIKKTDNNILQVGNREQLSIAITKYGYRPFVSYEFLDIKKNKNCLYVRKNSKVRNINDLKGRSLTMSANMIEYASLRQLIGEKPEIYFKPFTLVGDGYAPAYAFYMDNPDAMWITIQQIRFLKISNPEIVKDIRSIQCSEEHAHMAMLASPKISKETTDRMFASVAKIMKADYGVKYFPLARFLKVRMAKTSLEEYSVTLDLYKKAVSKGWVDDYKKLIARKKNEKN